MSNARTLAGLVPDGLDYEEGTFTPVYSGSSTAGTYSYSFQNGWYTKIGNIVHVIIALYDITDSTEGSGNVKIEGLPFSSASNTVRTALGGVFLSRWTLSGEPYLSFLSNNRDYLNILRPTSGSAGTGANLALTDRASDSADIMISMTYQVD